MAWRCDHCGQTNVVEGYPCLRCNRLPSGDLPKAPKTYRKTKHSLRQFRTLVLAAIATVGLSYVIVLHQGNGSATDASCAQGGIPRVADASLTNSFAQLPDGFTADSQKALDSSDLAGLFVNSADSQPQRDRDLRIAIDQLTQEQFSQAAQLNAHGNNTSLTITLEAFPTAQCATHYFSEAKAQLHKATNRFHGAESVLTQPGGAIEYSFPPDGINTVSKVLFVNGGYIGLVQSPDSGLAKTVSISQSAYLPQQSQ